MDTKQQKPRYHKRPNFNKHKKNYNDRKDNRESGNRIVYQTKSNGPEKLADWQLKLQAMSDCFQLHDREDYKELVEARYQELKHKQR